MKQTILLFIISFVMISCEPKKEKETLKTNYPSELSKVFEKHGGIENWKAIRTLSFNKGDESHTTDLWSRKTVVQSPNFSLGYDGENIWVSDSTAYKGNATFYYNLFFYFYAMPFVLADNGIIYENAEALSFDGVSYPGIKISYVANVGTSPDDNYIIYYHPETYQMEWLAYTVTFNSKKPSERYNLIKYEDWENVGNVLLPKAINWYKKDENGIPIEPRGNAVEFTLAAASEKALKDSFYQKPSE